MKLDEQQPCHNSNCTLMRLSGQ